ncbi:MAG: hypothetical protein J0M08_04180 [Bacteroidetes bacterium]|nr:hypothetical protein [Bacteroidota bacterium]
MRITFINDTPLPITDLQTIGCESKKVGTLAPHESKTVWVKAKGGARWLVCGRGI